MDLESVTVVLMSGLRDILNDITPITVDQSLLMSARLFSLMFVFCLDSLVETAYLLQDNSNSIMNVSILITKSGLPGR